MKRTWMITLVAVVGVFAIGRSVGDEVFKDRIEASRTVAQGFTDQLRTELQQAITASGPVGAIQTCRLIAPAIAAETSRATEWRVGRTSLKTRNPLNTPDSWEAKVLAMFEQRKAAGEDPAALEYWERTIDGGQQQFRYMKAIPTTEMCLACHGTDIAADVQAKLDQLYPNDQARGFRLGDIRGAFTITQPL